MPRIPLTSSRDHNKIEVYGPTATLLHKERLTDFRAELIDGVLVIFTADNIKIIFSSGAIVDFTKEN